MKGVGGTTADAGGEVELGLLSSTVDILRPRLLGLRLAGFGGTMKAGVGGAENA